MQHKLNGTHVLMYMYVIQLQGMRVACDGGHKMHQKDYCIIKKRVNPVSSVLATDRELPHVLFIPLLLCMKCKTSTALLYYLQSVYKSPQL